MDLAVQSEFESKAAALRDTGICVLPGAIAPQDVAAARDTIVAQQTWFPRTRQAAHSRHLAGFHRFEELRSVLDLIGDNPTLQRFLDHVFGGAEFRDFGLSDITINRSQPWHTDLLRGRYAQFLDGVDVWDADAPPCLKALLYLQNGKSLRLVAGSHHEDLPLDDAVLDRIANERNIDQLELGTGDIVVMDIRTLHRGSTDQEMAAPALATTPKILVSNVYGVPGTPFADAMSAGNAARLASWDERNNIAGPPGRGQRSA